MRFAFLRRKTGVGESVFWPRAFPAVTFWLDVLSASLKRGWMDGRKKHKFNRNFPPEEMRLSPSTHMERTNMCAHQGRERPIFLNKKLFFLWRRNSAFGDVDAATVGMQSRPQCQFPNTEKISPTVFASDRRRGGGRGGLSSRHWSGFSGLSAAASAFPRRTPTSCFFANNKNAFGKIEKGGFAPPSLPLKLELAEQFNSSSTPQKYRKKLFGNAKSRNNNR